MSQALDNYEHRQGIQISRNLIPIEDIAAADLHADLRPFMACVRRIYPACEFALAGSSNVVFVYHPHKPLTMGKIGVGNFRNKSSWVTDYMVCSPNINNEKYAPGSDQSHMKMTRHLEVAERNVKKFLRDQSPIALSRIFEAITRGKWRYSDSTLNHRIKESFSGITTDLHGVVRELQNLVRSGYEFLDPEFSDKVRKLVALHEQRVEETSGRVSALTMVSVEQSHTSTLFSVTSTPDISRGDIMWAAKGTFTEDTLQANYPDVVSKIAMLQMCAVNQWVDGVGYKATSTVYYVIS